MPASQGQELNKVKIFLPSLRSPVKFLQGCPCCLSEADSSIKIGASYLAKPYRISRSREIPYCFDFKGHLKGPAFGLIGCATWVFGILVGGFSSATCRDGQENRTPR